MYKGIPWSHEQLNEMLPKLVKSLNETEAEFNGNIKAVPPLTVDEAADYLIRLVDLAAKRTLTAEECFLHGQMLCVFKMAVQAETLGYKEAGGRYFVASEKDLDRLIKGGK